MYFRSLSVFIVALIISLVTYTNLTPEIPIHWSGGEHGNYVPKVFAILFMPVFMIINVLVSLMVLKKKETYQERRMILSVNHVVLLILFILHLLIVSWGLKIQYIMPHYIGVVVGGVLIILAINMQKTKPNMIYGLRTPWTLKDERVWEKSNHFAGQFLFVMALMIIGLSFVVADFISQIIMYLILLSVLVSVFMSYWYDRKLNS
ncbi:SdpI family protein [Piscibacillus sp. B03]|uniref:SdpI family protein n=1 Tax=Piscibacillus sp. B03 TaxID=3457430 RepID=UPI003FCD6E4D